MVVGELLMLVVLPAEVGEFCAELLQRVGAICVDVLRSKSQIVKIQIQEAFYTLLNNRFEWRCSYSSCQ